MDKWQAKATQALGKKRRGPHQIGMMMGKPQVDKEGKDGARKHECGRKGCWNWENEEGNFLQVVEIGSQQEIEGGPCRKVAEVESQHGIDGGPSLQVAEVDSRDQKPYWHEERDAIM